MALKGMEKMDSKLSACYGFLVAACVSMVMLGGCSVGNDGQEEMIVEVPVITSLTGPTASWGEMQRRGTELAVEEVNSMGGLNGYQVIASYDDDQGKPEKGVSALQKVIAESKVPIAVGFPLSGVTLAASGIANRDHFVLLSSGSTAQAVGEAGPWIFRIMPSDEVQAGIVAEWALSLGYGRIGVLYVENAWGVGLKDNFISTFRERGGVVSRVEASHEGDTDFRSQIAGLESTSPDALYFPLYQKDAGLAIRHARQVGFEGQVFGADVYQSPEFLETAGKYAEGVLYATFGVANNEKYRQFAKKHQDKFGVEPGNYTAYAYDAFLIAVEALRSAGWPEATAEDVRRSLLEIRGYHGVTGTLSFESSTSASGASFQRMTVRSGEFVQWEDR